MRNIIPQWRDLAEGLLTVEALEAQFRAGWGPQLEETRRQKAEAARQKLKERGRAALTAASVLALLLFATALVLSLLFPPPSPVVNSTIILTLVLPTILALYGIWSLLRTPDSMPDPSDLSSQWWGTISGPALSVRRSGPTLSARRYGDEGEKAFVSYLYGKLSGEYVAVRGLLVTRSLDADVIVAGPTGIWVYEVKHWSGQITCEGGKWRRVKIYRESGGRLVQEHEVLRPFDKQWVKEAATVKETLKRRLPQYPNLRNVVGGGLVFTHERCSLSVDNSCEARVYTPRSCVEALSGFSKIPHFTMEKRLRAIDALLEWSDRLHEQQGGAPSTTSSSVELAEFLHKDAVSHAVSYLSSSDETSGGATIPGSNPQDGP